LEIPVSTSFKNRHNKLPLNQRKAIDKAVLAISENPEIGTEKLGDLEGIFVYKFRVLNEQWLVAYRHLDKKRIRILLVGAHQNFYRELREH
jgi:hypothetical protein